MENKVLVMQTHDKKVLTMCKMGGFKHKPAFGVFLWMFCIFVCVCHYTYYKCSLVQLQ